MKHKKYYVKDITPRTRLSDLVEKKYHPQLKRMIEELRRLTTLTGDTEWWRVRELKFINPHTQRNYEPIARFLWATTRNENNGLKCSINTFFYYLASSYHSNLSTTWKSVKTLTYSRIRHEHPNTKR